jgi:hypothetical protein
VTLTGLLLLAPFAQPPPAPTPWPALQCAEWATFGYQTLPDGAAGDFALSGRVALKGSRPPARIAFDIVDESNYHALELAHDAARLIRVESGLALPLAESQGARIGGGSHDLLLRREGAELRAFVDGVQVLAASDDAFPSGKIAVGSSIVLRDPLVQDLAPAYFDDDFMRNPGEMGGWRTAGGHWAVQSVGSPVRSSNAFNLTSGSAPRGASALYGDWFWHDYEVSVSCQPHGFGQAGVYAHYADPGNHYLLVVTQAPKAASGEAELVRMVHGKRVVLGSAQVPFPPGQWYRIGLRVAPDEVVGVLDGHDLVSAPADGLPGGKAGLFARGAEGVTFDDFSVRQTPALAERLPNLALFRAIGGEWRVDGSAGAAALHGRSSSPAKLLLGERPGTDLVLSARVADVKAAEVGLVAGWEDEGNYGSLTLAGSPASLRLTRVLEGQPTVLAEAPAPATAGPVDLTLRLRGGLLTGGVTGAPELAAWEPVAPAGRAGLFVRDGEATFASLDLRRLAPLPEVAHFDGTFTQEVSMAEWAAENSDWTTAPPGEGDPGPASWHRSPAYGDRHLSIHLPVPPPGPVVAVLGASEPGAADGYRLAVTPGTPGSVTLYRAGAVAASKSLGDLPAEAVRRVGLAEHGPMLIASLNDRPVLTFADPQPLTGLYSAWSAPPGTAQPKDAVLAADNVLSYSFCAAPDDWWVGSGDWRITNRWDCEPRWTFFIGGGKGVACLWNKHEFGPDLTFDFYGAIRFDSTRGYEYPHAANINCTIAADGRDLTTGYSLVFGGWDDKYTRLLRGTQVVAESASAVIPRASSIHRQWFNVRIRKAGGRIRCWIDGAPAFDYTDPEPLTGTRAAIWTYDNAIAVARVRIAASDVRPGPLEPPQRPPKSCYDQPAG